MNIELDATTVREALTAVKSNIRAIENDNNSFRREVGVATRVPQLKATAAKLAAALELAVV